MSFTNFHNARVLMSGVDYWQGMQFNGDGFGNLFFTMCDTIEGAVGNTSGSSIPAAGIGLEKALPNFASWFKTSFLNNRT